jgi:sialidase-1
LPAQAAAGPSRRSALGASASRFALAGRAAAAAEMRRVLSNPGSTGRAMNASDFRTNWSLSRSFAHCLMLLVACLAALAIGKSADPPSAAAAEPVHVDVFVGGTEGYHTYRIPALLVTPRGTLLAFCEGRKTSRADHGDVDLMLRRSLDGGRTWQPMQLVYEEGGDRKVTIGNPCPVVDRSTGRIWLPMTRDNDAVLITYSDDDGQTWAAPRDITADVKLPGWTWYATGPGVGIQLARGQHAGRLVIPCDHRRPLQGAQVTHSHVFYSDDQGRTWKLGGTVAPYTNECQVVELRTGRLLINMRNYWGRDARVAERGGMRAVATSDDAGESWSELRFDRQLVEPVCQASLIALSVAKHPQGDDDATLLVFSNPASATARHRLTVRLSRDSGASWPAARLLCPGPAAYSCLAELPDGQIGCLYETGQRDPYERVVFARFTLDWLQSQDQSLP